MPARRAGRRGAAITRGLAWGALWLVVSTGAAVQAAQPEAPSTAPATGPGSRFDASGFPEGPGRELVVQQCTACHSGKLVQQNRATREGWREILRWMQRSQNLWVLPPDMENRILAYLATHFGRPGEADEYRRPPLDESLMPPSALAVAPPRGEKNP